MILAGIELSFFTGAHMMLCSGFWMKIVVVSHFFSCCRAVLTEPRTFSASCASLPAGRLGVHQRLAGDQADRKDIPYYTMTCSAKKARVKNEECSE